VRKWNGIKAYKISRFVSVSDKRKWKCRLVFLN
jgi:hypothetical protein